MADGKTRVYRELTGLRFASRKVALQRMKKGRDCAPDRIVMVVSGSGRFGLRTGVALDAFMLVVLDLVFVFEDLTIQLVHQ